MVDKHMVGELAPTDLTQERLGAAMELSAADAEWGVPYLAWGDLAVG